MNIIISGKGLTLEDVVAVARGGASVELAPYFQSIPAAADQEDFVSMGMNSARKTRQILDLANGVIGIEALAAAQALDLRGHRPGRGTGRAREAVRRHVAFLETDRPLYPDRNRIKTAFAAREILSAVEEEIGALRTY